jgi:hypothetical protein
LAPPQDSSGETLLAVLATVAAWATGMGSAAGAGPGQAAGAAVARGPARARMMSERVLRESILDVNFSALVESDVEKIAVIQTDVPDIQSRWFWRRYLKKADDRYGL